MTTNPATLRDTDTVEKALDTLLSLHVLTLPVLDEHGRYLGMFGKHRILSLLMPGLAGLDDRLPTLTRLGDFAVTDDNIDDVRERLSDVGNDPIGHYVESDAPAVSADAPLLEAMLVLYRTRNYLPVLNADGNLAGVLTAWDVLRAIAAKN